MLKNGCPGSYYIIHFHSIHKDDRLAELERSVPMLQQQLAAAQKEAAQWKAAYENLKQRAVNAYRLQQEEIEMLKKRLREK